MEPSTPTALSLTINGESREFRDVRTVADLLATLQLDPRRVAVEVNEALVRRGSFAAAVLSPGDRVELVTLVGGG